jgi:hypothetical protein
MRDFLNQELLVGDSAILGTPTGQGRGFRVVQVVKFSTKMVQVTNPHAVTAYGRRNTSVYPDQLVKILPEQLTWYAITK